MTGLRILVTGSRRRRDRDTIRRALAETIAWWRGRGGTGPVTVIHGGAPGADTEAHLAARALGLRVEVHPSKWHEHVTAAGPLRDQQMIATQPDICLAFPLGGPAVSPGTHQCIQACREHGIPVRIYPHGAGEEVKVAGISMRSTSAPIARCQVTPRCAHSGQILSRPITPPSPRNTR